MPISDRSTARHIADALLEIGAVRISPDDPFTWASGLRSPLYCDNRLTISYPDTRRMIRDGFVSVLEMEDLKPDAVVGTATAGIPHAAWLADALDLPMAYVRSKPKEHGTGSQIEGRIESGTRVVVIEDLVSTGQSSRRVLEALRAEEIEVSAVLAIFSYELDESKRAFETLRVPLHTLTNFRELYAAAKDRGELSAAAVASLQEWRRDAVAWSNRHS